MANQQNIDKHKFKKGKPGGPGRKKGSKSIVAILRHLLEKKIKAKDLFDGKKEKMMDASEVLAIRLISMAIGGNIKAIKEVMERVDGKVAQNNTNLNLTFDDISNMTDEQLEEARNKLKEEL